MSPLSDEQRSPPTSGLAKSQMRSRSNGRRTQRLALYPGNPACRRAPAVPGRPSGDGCVRPCTRRVADPLQVGDRVRVGRDFSWAKKKMGASIGSRVDTSSPSYRGVPRRAATEGTTAEPHGRAICSAADRRIDWGMDELAGRINRTGVAANIDFT